MVIKRRTGTKAAASEDAAPDTGITNVTVGRSFTIPGEGEYESQKVSVMVSAPSYDEASAAVDTFMVSEFEKSSEQFAQFRAAADELAEEVGKADTEEGEAAEGEEEGEAEGEAEVSEDDIRTMSRKELTAFITENDVSVDPDDFEKTKTGTAEMADAVIEALAGEDLTEEAIRAMDRSELVALIKGNDLDIDFKAIKRTTALAEAVIEALTEPDPDAEPEADAEEGEEEGEEEGAEEGDLTADDVRAMERSELLALNKEHDLGLKTKGKEDEEVAEMVIEALNLEAEGEEGEAAEGEENQTEGYSRKELEAMKPKDLQAIYKGWGIKDKFPTGSAPVVMKKAVNRIMAYQETGK